MAVSYDGQAWFDSEDTWNNNFAAFLAEQKKADYTLGDLTSTADGDMEMYTDLKIKSAQETEKIADFNTAKDQAFADLRATHDQELIDLGVLWQAKEDNDYDVDYTPA